MSKQSFEKAFSDDLWEISKSRKNIKPNTIWVSGGKHFSICQACGQIVRIDKPIIGSMHICVE